MLVAAIGVLAGVLPLRHLAALLTGLHYTIGISAPTPRQVRWTIIVWIVSMLLIVDLLFCLLRWVF